MKRIYPTGKDHHNYGKHLSEETKKKMSESRKKLGLHTVFTPEQIEKIRRPKIGEKNPMWKGDKVSYKSLHDWVRRNLPIPELCQICKQSKPYDAANISGKYLRDLSDWKYLCRKCHMNSDGRMYNLYQYKK